MAVARRRSLRAIQRGFTLTEVLAVVAIMGVLATLVSLSYYLAVIRAMYMRPAAELELAPIGGSPPREIMLSSAAFIAMVVNVGAFFAVQPLVDFARSAAATLPL